MRSASVPAVLDIILRKSGQRSKGCMIGAAVPTDCHKTLHARLMGAPAFCACTDVRYLKGREGFVAFVASKAVRSAEGDPMKEISFITMIPFPPIASGTSSVQGERDVVIRDMPFQMGLNMDTKT